MGHTYLRESRQYRIEYWGANFRVRRGETRDRDLETLGEFVLSRQTIKYLSWTPGLRYKSEGAMRFEDSGSIRFRAAYLSWL